jgi:hypothetical protein
MSEEAGIDTSRGTPGRRPKRRAYTEADDAIDFRAEPYRYRIARGEQGVFHVRPYKDDLVPLWRFRTPQLARASADALWDRFLAYKETHDFVGMDMARKVIQMGFTRARRYANHAGGRKYAADGSELPRRDDPIKAESAATFKETLDRVLADPDYQARKADHLVRFEQAAVEAACEGRSPGTPSPSP